MPRTRWPVLLAFALWPAFTGCQMRPPRAVPTRPVFYPLPPDPPRIQYLTSINASWDVVPERQGLARIVLGPRDLKERNQTVERPYGIAVWQGRIYLCDQRSRDVKVFDLLHRAYYGLDKGRGLMATPTNLCTDPGGNKFVVESMRGMIHVFDANDDYLATFRVKDARPGDVTAVGAELFVTDVTGDRVLVLDRSTGKLLRTLGAKGKGPGQFIMPNAIASDPQGNLYVSDQMNFRFQKLDPTGKPLLTIGGAGDSYGHFARPRGIAVGPDGTVYVVESVYEVVQMFDPKGQVLMGFGNFHGAPGFLELPAGIATDTSCLPYFRKHIDPRFEADYLIFVASQVGSARIGVYAFGHLRPGAELPAVPSLTASDAPEKKPTLTPAPPPR